MFSEKSLLKVIIVQSGLKLYDLTVVAEGVESLPSCACLIELKMELELEQIISVQLKKKRLLRNRIFQRTIWKRNTESNNWESDSTHFTRHPISSCTFGAIWTQSYIDCR